MSIPPADVAPPPPPPDAGAGPDFRPAQAGAPSGRCQEAPGGLEALTAAPGAAEGWSLSVLRLDHPCPGDAPVTAWLRRAGVCVEIEMSLERAAEWGQVFTKAATGQLGEP